MCEKVVRQDLPQHNVQIAEVPMDPFQNLFGMYLDNLCGGVNYMGNSMDLLFSHLKIKSPANIPQQILYIPTWEELWAVSDVGSWISGASDEEDDER